MCDLAGNVQEWAETRREQVDRMDVRFLCGGSALWSDPMAFRCISVSFMVRQLHYGEAGFRAVRLPAPRR